MRERRDRCSRVLGMVALCAVILTLACASSYATNLIQNPSFENFTAGTTYGDDVIQWINTWRYFSVNGAGGTLNVITPGEDGQVALEMSRTSMNGDCGVNTTDLSVQEGQAYRIEFWAKSTTGTPLRFIVASFKGSSDGPGNHLGDTVSQQLALTDTWTKYVLSYMPPANCVIANVAFRAAAAGGSVCFDNVSMEATDNIFPDPSFDSFTAGSSYNSEYSAGPLRFFTVNDAGGSLNVISPGQDGDTAIELSRTSMGGDTGIGTMSTYPVKAGRGYRTMFWAKSDTGTPICYRVASFDATGKWLGDTVNVVYTPTSKWSLCAATYTAPEGCTNVNMAFRVWSDTGSVAIDNVMLTDESKLTGNLFPDSSFDSFVLGDTFNHNVSVGPFSFFSGNDVGGVLTVVPGRDEGGTAVQMSRISGGADTGMNLSLRIPAKFGHVYNLKFWAKSTTGQTQMRATMAGFQTNLSTWVKDVDYFFTPDTDWTECSGIYTPSSPSIAYIIVGLRAWGDNSDITIDDIEITDITSSYMGTLTGTVTNALTGAGIPNASVEIESDAGALSATADANGVYTINDAPSGNYKLTASAAGYKTTSFFNVGVSVTSTKNVGILPANTTWSVYDTFTRNDTQPGDDPLGTTEGTFAIPWVKLVKQDISWFGNTNSYISNNTLVTSYAGTDYGTSDCAVSLGQTFMPADFDFSIKMTWLNDYSSLWSAIGYRQALAGTMTQGYSVVFPFEGDQIQLQYNGSTIASGTLATAYPNWVDVTIRILVSGSSHKIYANNELVIDTVDNNNTGGGYIGLFNDGLNTVAWDDLNVGSLPDGTVSGTVTDSYTGTPISGATIAIAETGQTLQTDADGMYSVNLPPDKYTLTASADGYASRTIISNIMSETPTTVDFAMYTTYKDVTSIVDAKKFDNGTNVTIGETLVATIPSGTYTDGSYYVESENRAYGIKVFDGKSAKAGSRITGLAGTIKTDAYGERCIDVTDMTVSDGTPLVSLGMNNKAAVGSLTQSLLVRVWGKITAVASDNSYCYIDDGSNVQDGTGNVGIRVDFSNSVVPRLAPLFVDESVSVTGVMGLGKNDSSSIPVIRPKSSLYVCNTAINHMVITPDNLNGWKLTASGADGSVAFSAGPEPAPLGTGSIKLSVGSDGSKTANVRTPINDSMMLADITEMSVSSYMTSYGDYGGRNVGFMLNIQLDDVYDETNGWIDDQLVYDPNYGTYTKSLCALNMWQQWDVLNTGRWYSANGLAGMPDGVWGTFAQYVAENPQAKFAPSANGAFRVFIGYAKDYWSNCAGYVDNIRLGTKNGTTVYDFEP